MATFNDRENKVMSFMEEVQCAKEEQEQEDAFRNSTNYKLKCLDKCEDDAKTVCLDKIFAKIYKDAVPLSDDYKVAYGDDLDAEFRDFIDKRCPKGMEYYVKEGLRKGSPFAKRVLEAVEDLVNNEYHDKAMNIEDYKADDLVFKTDDDVQKKLDVISQDLQGEEIAQAIQDNVKQTAASEIARAKKEKESMKNLESELANDVNMNSEEKVESALEFYGVTEKKDFKPTLFQGIMIGKMNQIQSQFESGMIENQNLYGSVDLYKESDERTESGSAEEVAFIESVKEYTKLSLIKALKLESFTKRDVEDMAQDYAQMK